MTQEQLKEQAKDYVDYNLDNKSKLEIIVEILDDLSNELYYNGYITESTKLTTCLLTIKDVLKRTN